MMFYIDVDMVGRRLGRSFVKIVCVLSKKNIKHNINMVALGREKKMMRNFVIFILFVWAIMIIGYFAGWIAAPPTLLVMEIFF